MLCALSSGVSMNYAIRFVSSLAIGQKNERRPRVDAPHQNNLKKNHVQGRILSKQVKP
jgi:hypothetical protein